MHPRVVLLDRLKKDAYRSGRFTLASGLESDFFIDCKKVILTARGHQLVGKVLYDEILSARWETIDGVAGVALGGCPLASAVSLVSAQCGRNWDALYVRKEPKDHGTGARIEGSLNPGSKVVLLEDVLTTGKSSISAITALTDAGYHVCGVLALVNRNEGGVEALMDIGMEIRPIYHRREFLDQT